MSAAEEKKNKKERKSQLPVLGVHQWKKNDPGNCLFHNESVKVQPER